MPGTKLLNQHHIKKWSIDTVVNLQALTTLNNGDTIFCIENGTTYKFYSNSALVHNGTSILGSNSTGASPKLVGIAGRYIYMASGLLGVESVIDSVNLLASKVSVLEWDQSKYAKYEDWQTANNISSLDTSVIVRLIGTGHILADNSTPLGLTNADKVWFIGDVNNHKLLTYSAKKPVFLDGFTNLLKGVDLDIQANISVSEASGCCITRAKNIKWYLGSDCRVYWSDIVNVPVGIIFDTAPLRITSVTGNGSLAEVVTSYPHYLRAGDSIKSSSWSDSDFNDTFTVDTVIDDYNFTFVCSGSGTPTGGVIEESVKRDITLDVYGHVGDLLPATPGGTLAGSGWFYGLPVPTISRKFILNSYDGGVTNSILYSDCSLDTLEENVIGAGTVRDMSGFMSFAGVITTSLFSDAFNIKYNPIWSGLGVYTIQEAIDLITMGTLNSPLVFEDDFLGIERGEWSDKYTDGVVELINGYNGQVKFKTNALTGSKVAKDFGGYRWLNYSHKAEFEIKIDSIDNTSVKFEFGFVNNDEYIKLVADTSVDGYWHIQAKDSNANSLDVQLSTEITHIGTIKVAWAGEDVLVVYADGVEVFNHNIKTDYSVEMINSDLMQPIRYIETLADAEKQFVLDYFKIWQNRELVYGSL